MKKMLSLLLTVLMALTMLTGAAMAEEAAASFDLFDLTLNIGDKAYTFPMSIDACKEAGLNVPEFNALSEGQYYPSLSVDNGRSAFDIRVELCGDEHWATGVQATSENVPGATIGGIVIGETTRGELEESLGEPRYSYDEEIDYYVFGSHLRWSIYFESTGTTAKVRKVVAHSMIPAVFGVDFEAVDEQGAELPDVSSMAFTDFILEGVHYTAGTTVQDLLDNGWVLDSGFDETVKGASSALVYGCPGYIYNGTGLAYIKAYNYADTEASINDCIVNYVEVYNSYKTSLIFADGITIGSTLEEAEATLGAHASESEENGVTIYGYTVLNGVDYTIHVEDGVIVQMAIEDMY